MIRRRSPLALLVGLSAAVAGCGPGGGSGQALYAHEERRFAVRVDRDPPAPGAWLRVEARAPWKLSTEFPARAELGSEGPGTGLVVIEPARGDEERVAFRLPVPAGPVGGLSGRVRFAICHGERCDRLDHDWAVPSAAGAE